MKRLLPTLFLLALAVTQLHAQDLIIPKQGNPITAYNVEAGAKFFFYTTEPSEDSPTLKIAKDSVLMVRKVDGSVLAPSPEVSAAAPAPKNTPAQSNFPEIKEEDIHGSLIAKGNCVYIPTDGQKTVLYHLAAFLLSEKPNPTYLLQGYAGTGKYGQLRFLRREYPRIS